MTLVACYRCANWAPKMTDALSRQGFAPCHARNTPHTGYASIYPRECSLFKPAPPDKVQRRREVFGITGDQT